MGIKAKKALKKKLKKVSSQLSVSVRKSEAPDFLPLEGGPGRKLPEQKPLEDKATVLYLGRIPHGFYEKEMEGFFSQFGKIKRLRIARNKKVGHPGLTGKSKHFGFIEFESTEVAKIVADCMHNQLLFEHLLQVHLIPPEHVHPKIAGDDHLPVVNTLESNLAIACNALSTPLLRDGGVLITDTSQLTVFKLNGRGKTRYLAERTLEEHHKLVEKIMKRDLKRKKRIEAAGIEYECPGIVGNVHPAPKKIKFVDE
ncbi:hypothetical protein CJ030_MR5G023730 [Morella rubra]|uniref:RRM domain-containing protein n=1 Tax=Morella rubra TaxID=262757 RepID=A0A6A1VGG1_9ROSI|nr:hypothetical protein CJ030_MR5G023730 [Morella rubra]